MWFGRGSVPRRMERGSGEEALVEVSVRLAWSLKEERVEFGRFLDFVCHFSQYEGSGRRA